MCSQELAVKRATQALGVNVEIKKFGNEIVFWKENGLE